MNTFFKVFGVAVAVAGIYGIVKGKIVAGLLAGNQFDRTVQGVTAKFLSLGFVSAGCSFFFVNPYASIIATFCVFALTWALGRPAEGPHNSDARLRMREIVEVLSEKLALQLSQQSHASVITIEKPNGLTFVVTVPDDVLEWFVTASECGKEIWSDWVDYYACEGETRQDLEKSMTTEISAYIEALATSKFRLSPASTPDRKSWHLEWYRHGTWRPVSVSVE